MRMRGFTLLEVLIAVSITAMIGVGATQLLSNVIDSRRAIDIKADQLASLQRFNMVVSRDIEQIINRTIRDEYGETQPALMLESGQYLLEFTRAGWRNSPLAEEPRSELQRVAYRLESIHSDPCESARIKLENWGIVDEKGQCLVRYFWPVLDRANNSEPIAQMVLEQVDELEIEVLARSVNTLQGESATGGTNTNRQINPADWFTVWPATNMGAEQSQEPQAVRWRVNVPRLGDIKRLWLVSWATDL